MRRAASASMAASTLLISLLAAIPAHASGRSFSCTQTTTGRATNRQAVTGTLDANSAPHNVRVVRVYSGATEFGPVANPPLKNGGSFAYWHATYHLDGYDLGATSAPPFGARQGTFGVPQNPPGVTGTTFRALLLEDWLPSYGQWQKWFDCTVS